MAPESLRTAGSPVQLYIRGRSASGRGFLWHPSVPAPGERNRLQRNTSEGVVSGRGLFIIPSLHRSCDSGVPAPRPTAGSR